MPGDLTNDFSRREFRCKCAACKDTEPPVDFRLVAALQALRDEIGARLDISSGYRCPAHNKAEKGAPDSLHMRGQAADVFCPDGWTIDRFAEAAEGIEAFGGIGIYNDPPRLHLDVREGRWRHDYR